MERLYKLQISIESDEKTDFEVEFEMNLGALEDVISEIISDRQDATKITFVILPQ